MSGLIEVKDLSKKYRIGLAHSTTIREALMKVLTFSSFRQRSEEDIIWALRDVSFSIGPGEVVGIIGRNGAGKSTLLKILSKITYPTTGSVTVGGRVAAMLEVGTGFHPELTGLENIYLNGSILGMTKKEVDRKLAAIIEFSGVEKFINTPIKRYSSGMRLRLGFAVAAHLDSEVLIVDEVLAVGDAAFQKKCLAVMGDLRSRARTVLFVSHNLAAVENLCKRCIWIDNGQIRMDGEPRSVIKAYMDATSGESVDDIDLESTEQRRGNGKLQFRRIDFLSPEMVRERSIRAGDPVVIRFHFHASENVAYPSIGFRLYTDMGTLVTETSTWHHGIDIPMISAGDGYIDLAIECLNLMPGRYPISLWATDDGGTTIYDNIEAAVNLEVELGNIYKSGKELDGRCGLVFFPQEWNLAGIGSTNQPNDSNECQPLPR
ncbi:MAG TPA: ABC transporter ATP-binding protein [Terracidiphilus sp.]|jgi:lipopolysaccharide transport system ATP-binding protein